MKADARVVRMRGARAGSAGIEAAGARATGASAAGARAIGALAAGALALGALAVGALAVGRLSVGRARIRRLEIDELAVGELNMATGPRPAAQRGAVLRDGAVGEIGALAALDASGGERAEVERFFGDYVAAFNGALLGTPDLDSIRAAFAPCFVAAGPQGVGCGLNDERFTATLEQGFAYYRSIGMQDVQVRALALTPIDADHLLARVSYRSQYRRRASGERVTIDFEVGYLLEIRAGKPKIFGFVAGDERAAFREHGLAPVDPENDREG